MLELKTLQLQDSTLFRNKLSKVAAQMPNREALFTLLYQQKPTKTKVEAPKVIEKPETISQEIILEAPSKPTKTKVEAPKATEKTETISQEINLEALAKLTKTKVEAPKVIEKPETISQEIKLKAPSKKEIIDQFIRTSPAIRRPETKVATDETPLVDHSIDEKYDLVSETLAELYLQQGAKEKAVKVYQKLILIYPEKISFFAARIFEIQNNQ
jgi:tetratricopeptide (TPR) repeat protein